MTDKAKGDVGEEVDHSGMFEKRAEKDEQKYETGGHVDRYAVDALGSERHVIDDLGEGVAAMIKRRRQILTEEAVGEENRADDGQGRAKEPAGALEDEDDQDHPDDDILRFGCAGSEDQVPVEGPLVEPGGKAEEPEAPGDDHAQPVACPPAFEERKRQQEQKPDVHATHDLRWQDAVRRREDLKRGKSDGNPEEKPLCGGITETGCRAVLEVSRCMNILCVAGTG